MTISPEKQTQEQLMENAEFYLSSVAIDVDHNVLFLVPFAFEGYAQLDIHCIAKEFNGNINAYLKEKVGVPDSLIALLPDTGPKVLDSSSAFLLHFIKNDAFDFAQYNEYISACQLPAPKGAGL